MPGATLDGRSAFVDIHLRCAYLARKQNATVNPEGCPASDPLYSGYLTELSLARCRPIGFIVIRWDREYPFIERNRCDRRFRGLHHEL